jgi:hypothetical protein
MGGRTTIKIVACRAFSTQFRNLRSNLAQLVKGVVQLYVEHGDQVDHAAVTPNFEGKTNANHVRARISNSHTQRLYK